MGSVFFIEICGIETENTPTLLAEHSEHSMHSMNRVRDEMVVDRVTMVE